MTKKIRSKAKSRFDCVAMKRRGAARVYRQIQGMTVPEEVAYWAELSDKLCCKGSIPISVYELRIPGQTGRSNRHLIGKSVPSAQSVDHVPILAARPLFTSATSL